jgi:hypothetical protein
LDQYILLKIEEPVLDRAIRAQFDTAGVRIFRRPDSMQADATEEANTTMKAL